MKNGKQKKRRWYFKGGAYEDFTVIFDDEKEILVKNDNSGKYSFGNCSDFGSLYGFPVGWSNLTADEAIRAIGARIDVNRKYIGNDGGLAEICIARKKSMLEALKECINQKFD